MQKTIDIKKYSSFIKTNSFVKKTGNVSRIIGLMIESNGPGVAIGSICAIKSRNKPPIEAQVVGFRDNQTLLMPLGDIFGKDKVKILADTNNLTFLGGIPLNKEITKSSNIGKPFVIKNSEITKSFEKITNNILSLLGK